MGRLVGREHARSGVLAALDDAGSGAGRVLLVSGEPGIGKSALLSWLAEQASPGWRVLRGFCWEGAGAPPYWPWTQIAEQVGAAAMAWPLEGHGPDGAGPLARPASVAAADAQFRLFDVIARSLADHGPAVVMIDDLHWADEPSLQLLSYLDRALATRPVLLVGAYRDTEASPGLEGLVARARHIPLRGLSLAEVRALVDAMPGSAPAPELTEQVWRRSGGNPFFVGELTRLLQAQGSATHLPASVIETVRRRLARLSTESVRLLDWAAVAGRDIDLPLLVQSGAIDDEATARDLLDQARHAGIVTGATFGHDLYREAIVDAQPASLNAAINLAIGRALQARVRPGEAARVAAHLLPAGAPEAYDWCLRAAREATARLGHDDACGHYRRALSLVEDVPAQVLLELAAAHGRAGATEEARRRYREAAGRGDIDPVSFAHAALGLQSLGHRSGAQNAEVLDGLREAARRLDQAGGDLTLQSRVLAALTRATVHSATVPADTQLVEPARRAVKLAERAGDAGAQAEALLALHDALWSPGTAGERLPVIAEMLDAASTAGDRDLVAQAHQLRAAALIELGDPAGRDELLTYISLAAELGHARGRWGALTRQATYAQIAGRADEAARLGQEALALGRAIGEPDAMGCFATSRGSLVALGVDPPEEAMDMADPMWPMFPVLRAWAPAVRGDLATARAALGDFSVRDIVWWTGLEAPAVAAAVFAAVGSTEQRRWAYDTLLPHAGTHVVVGGCASYHAAVDHHLGALAAALGDIPGADRHFRAALAQHERLGAGGWARLSAQALAALSDHPANEFRLQDGRWLIRYAGQDVHLPDAKGLRDLWVILGAHGQPVHVRTLLNPSLVSHGADPVLDDRAKAAYRARLDELARLIDDADDLGDAERADSLGAEREALIRELAAAAGLGGRTRRLGDGTERARKTISARLRDTLSKLEAAHPRLGAHLRGAVRMGTTCSYHPPEPTRWRLT